MQNRPRRAARSWLQNFRRTQRRAQSRDVELLGETVVVQVIAVRRVYGWIELDQHVAGLHRLPVLHSN